jgi:hypothetical protein
VLSYSKLVAELDQMIQKMIFESYGVDKYFEPHKESSYYLLRLMKYRVPDASEGNLGFRPHSDELRSNNPATLPRWIGDRNKGWPVDCLRAIAIFLCVSCRRCTHGMSHSSIF